MTTLLTHIIAFLAGTCTMSAVWLWCERRDAIAANLALQKPKAAAAATETAERSQGKYEAGKSIWRYDDGAEER